MIPRLPRGSGVVARLKPGPTGAVARLKPGPTEAVARRTGPYDRRASIATLKPDLRSGVRHAVDVVDQAGATDPERPGDQDRGGDGFDRLEGVGIDQVEIFETEPIVGADDCDRD